MSHGRKESVYDFHLYVTKQALDGIALIGDQEAFSYEYCLNTHVFKAHMGANTRYL